MRQQFSDKFTITKVADLAADATANTSAYSAHYDTAGNNSALSFVAVVDIVSLAASKTLNLRIQHSDTTTAADFSDATDDYESDGIVTVPAAANGFYKVGYNGQKRYIRLRVHTVEATPGATARISFQAHNLVSVPNNTGL